MLECALWCSLAVGLVLCDWKFWHRRPDTDVTAQPAQSQRAELVDRSPSGHTAGQA
jgi:hypothetical protein